MQKKNIINLIKFHYDGDEFQFRNEVSEIAKAFQKKGDFQLAEYCMSFISKHNIFIPQKNDESGEFLKLTSTDTAGLYLPTKILEDIKGIINAINHNVGINTFLFEGKPGTGKTEAVKQLARILERNLYVVDFNSLIDSKLGQTTKNISTLFNELNNMRYYEKSIILLDEIDIIALDRINSNDIREMGRVTSYVLKELDGLNSNVVIIATTNLFKNFDKALKRRFSSIINFDRYNKDDLLEIGEKLLQDILQSFSNKNRNSRLFKKILNISELELSPAELKNIIKVSIAFSSPNDGFDYLRKLFKNLNSNLDINDTAILSSKGFTVREIEILTGISKSQVARKLNDGGNK